MEVSQINGELNVDNCNYNSINVDGNETAKYRILASAGNGGSINPSGETILLKGQEQLYVIVPNKGYEIEDVFVEGQSVGAVASYSFSNISCDHSIKAVFKTESIQNSEDQAAVSKVEDLIASIKDGDGVSIMAAYDAYVALSENQKKMINAALLKRLSIASKDYLTKNAVKKITLDGISHNIAAGKKIKLEPDIVGNNTSDCKLIWSSSNKKLATVDQKGRVLINKKAAGKSVIIKAEAESNARVFATWKITIMKGAVKKITIKGAKKKLKAGKTMKLKAKVTTTKGKTNKKLLWISSNDEYATVSKSGKVKALKAGKGKTVKITAMATDGSGKKKVVKIKIN